MSWYLLVGDFYRYNGLLSPRSWTRKLRGQCEKHSIRNIVFCSPLCRNELLAAPIDKNPNLYLRLEWNFSRNIAQGSMKFGLSFTRFERINRKLAWYDAWFWKILGKRNISKSFGHEFISGLLMHVITDLSRTGIKYLSRTGIKYSGRRGQTAMDKMGADVATSQCYAWLRNITPPDQI